MSEEERMLHQRRKECDFEEINNVRGRRNAMSEGRGMLC
jgi:hypothetical protein